MRCVFADCTAPPLPSLQMGNFAFFFCEAVFQFLPSFWLMIVLVLWEGLLGGATYVNAFYHIAKEVSTLE